MFQILRKLMNGKRKGDNGCVLVLGGSEMYVGAPAFAAQSFFRCGGDLVYIMTHESAVIPLKHIYDAIVIPFGYNERIIDKATVCVIGPGLGHCSAGILFLLNRILARLNLKDVPVVVDGDAIHFYKTGELDVGGNCVLTPNFKEAMHLTVADGHACIYKGELDRIVCGKEMKVVGDGKCRKRCGGQGDMLTGTLALFLSLEKRVSLAVCEAACRFIRLACSRTFERLGYAMTASDVVSDIPSVLTDVLNETYSN